MSVLKSYGKERANKHACPDNLLKLEACACTDKEVCQDLIRQSVPLVSGEAVMVASVVIAGEVHTLNEPISIDNPSLIRKEIQSIFDAIEIDSFFSWKYENEELTIQHIGAIPFEKVTLSNDVEITLVRNCMTGYLCDYQTNIVDDPGDLLYEGNAQTLANAPYAYDNAGTTAATTANQAAADQLKADIETALTALTVAFDVVTVTPDENFEAYLVSIIAPQIVPGSDPEKETEISIGGREFINCGCTEHYLREDGTRGLDLVSALKTSRRRRK